jgi:hypothetical protein
MVKVGDEGVLTREISLPGILKIRAPVPFPMGTDSGVNGR